MTANQKLELQEEDTINARIDGMICQAREDGKNSGILEGRHQGIHQGKRDIILTLLESMNISEVSKITKLSIKEIEDLRNIKEVLDATNPPTEYNEYLRDFEY